MVWNKAVQPQNYACKISSNSVDWLGSSWQPKQNRVPTSKRNTNTKNTTNRSYFKLNLCVNTYIYSCKGTLFIGGTFFELFFISSIWSIFGNVYPIMTLKKMFYVVGLSMTHSVLQQNIKLNEQAIIFFP